MPRSCAVKQREEYFGIAGFPFSSGALASSCPSTKSHHSPGTDPRPTAEAQLVPVVYLWWWHLW